MVARHWSAAGGDSAVACVEVAVAHARDPISNCDWVVVGWCCGMRASRATEEGGWPKSCS